MMNMKFIGAAFVGVAMMVATPAISASLSIVGGVADSLPGNFNPTPGVIETGLIGQAGVAADGTIGKGMAITRFQAAADNTSIGGGLQIDPLGSGAMVRVTFLGTEAGKSSDASMDLLGSSGVLNNKTAVAGDFIDFADAGGFVDFLFRTINAGGILHQPTITNGGISEFAPLSMSFSSVFTGSNGRDAVIAFLGNGGGDSDFDDMIVSIQIIPLPAGILLMLTALGGLAFVGRRRMAA